MFLYRNKILSLTVELNVFMEFLNHRINTFLCVVALALPRARCGVEIGKSVQPQPVLITATTLPVTTGYWKLLFVVYSEWVLLWEKC